LKTAPKSTRFLERSIYPAESYASSGVSSGSDHLRPQQRCEIHVREKDELGDVTISCHHSQPRANTYYCAVSQNRHSTSICMPHLQQEERHAWKYKDTQHATKTCRPETRDARIPGWPIDPSRCVHSVIDPSGRRFQYSGSYRCIAEEGIPSGSRGTCTHWVCRHAVCV
jgi:hypothetical protein